MIFHSVVCFLHLLVIIFYIIPNYARIIKTFAGNAAGIVGYSGDGGLATNALLNRPYSIRSDGSGNLIFSDYENHRIRSIAVGTNIITTIVGSGTAGSTGDGGPATSALLYNPRGIVYSTVNMKLYIADYSNHKIRQLDVNGIISNFAGTKIAMFSSDNVIASSSTINNKFLGMW
jgi:DNA-binding beta-propeller fold protein YncE